MGGDMSRLAKRLRKDVIWGRMPAYKAQQYAHEAILDGARQCPSLMSLSNLGRRGNKPSQCWADFCKGLDASFADKVLFYVCIPLKSGNEPGYLRVALPHAFFSAMYHENKEDLHLKCLAPILPTSDHSGSHSKTTLHFEATACTITLTVTLGSSAFRSACTATRLRPLDAASRGRK